MENIPPSLFKQMWSCLHAMPETATAMPLNMSYHQHMWQRREMDSQSMMTPLYCHTAPLQIACYIKQHMPQDLRDFGPVFWYLLQKSVPCQIILQNPS